MRITMGYPPTNNHYFTVARGRKILSTVGRKYLEREGWAVKSQQTEKFTEADRLRVCIYVYPPDKRKRDLDNIPKAVLDVLSQSTIPDDSNIDELIIKRKQVCKGGIVEVVITKIDVR